MNAVTKPASTAIGMVLRPQTFEQLVQFANMAAKSSMVPQAYKGKPEDIMLAIQMGSELGLAPMQALQNVACINGRPSVYGDALIGLCRQSATCKDVEETVTGDGEAMVATCKATRHGAAPVIHTFSVADAKKAGLWGKTGPWQQYPKRMLQMRARGFALRDAFPDVLRGLITVEEARDIPPDTFTGPTIEAKAEPTPRPEPAQTTVEWIKEMDMKFAQAATGEEVDELSARSDVQKVLDDHSRPKLRDRMKHIIAEAIRRTEETETSVPADVDAN